MAVNRATSTSPGFTTDYFGRCAICKEPIPELHSKCKCGAWIFHVNPQPKQRRLIDMLLATGIGIPVRIGYGGARGSAKSRGLRDAALVVASEVAQRLEGIVIYIVRSVWGDIEKNHINEFRLEHPEIFDEGWYKSKEFVFPDEMGKPRIACGYGDTFDDLRRFTRGPNIFMMLIDQAEGFSQADLDELHTPNRWPAAGAGAAKTGYFFNPGGKGAAFLGRVFVDRDFDEKMRLDPADFDFIQGYGWDNWDGWFANENVTLGGELITRDQFYTLPGELPLCPKGVYDQAWLNSVPDNHRFKIFVTQTSEGKKMWQKPDSIRLGELFGRFDVFAGQAFAGAWREDRVVLRK